MSDVLTRLLHAVDELDWPTVRDCFADEIEVDYTSLFGGSVEPLPADELVARWTALLPGFSATQHMTGPVLVDGDEARTHVRAHHWMPGGEHWTVYGHYVAQLSNGRIKSLTLRTYHQDGNTDLPNIAAKSTDRRT